MSTRPTPPKDAKAPTTRKMASTMVGGATNTASNLLPSKQNGGKQNRTEREKHTFNTPKCPVRTTGTPTSDAQQSGNNTKTTYKNNASKRCSPNTSLSKSDKNETESGILNGTKGSLTTKSPTLQNISDEGIQNTKEPTQREPAIVNTANGPNETNSGVPKVHSQYTAAKSGCLKRDGAEKKDLIGNTCKKSFAQKSQLKSHIMTRSCGDRTRCKYCNKQYDMFKKVRQHERRSHPAECAKEAEEMEVLTEPEYLERLADIEARTLKTVSIKEMMSATGLTQAQVRQRRESQIYKKYLERARSNLKASKATGHTPLVKSLLMQQRQKKVSPPATSTRTTTTATTPSTPLTSRAQSTSADAVTPGKRRRSPTEL